MSDKPNQTNVSIQSIPVEKCQLLHSVSTPVEVLYHEETKRIALVYYQGIANSQQAVRVQLDFDEQASKQFLQAAVGIATILEIDASEATPIKYV